MTKLVSIQYPSGSFGHFIDTILSVYGNQFHGKKLNYNFGPGGNSHAYPTLFPKYINSVDFDTDQFNRCKELYAGQSAFNTILVDSGIATDSNEFYQYIQPDLQLKIHYDDWSWPITAKLFYTRCMASVHNRETNLSEFIKPDPNLWQVADAWAVREKYFLFLRDHEFKNNWRLRNGELSLPITDILDYNNLHSRLSLYFVVDDFETFYKDWQSINYKYYDFYIVANTIWYHIKNKISYSLIDVSDIWTQSVVYYYIWLEFNFEVPHNDYSNWFTNTNDIVIMLNNHGVNV